MKKVLAILLAVLSVLGCFAVSASALDGEEPNKTESGYYIGQILTPGAEIKSAFETCETFVFTYSVAKEDAENVTSALQGKYADESFVGLVSFRDNIASFTSGELYAGTYIVKAAGDTVGEMEVKNGEFKSGMDIQGTLSKDELKELKDKDLELSIDYDYAKTTYYQYTTITAWEITSVVDTENSLTIKVKAVYETREPTGFESFVEKMYTNWCIFLDKLGDVLLKVVPKLIAFWAKILGKGIRTK